MKMESYPNHRSRNGGVPAWEKRFCLVVGRMLWKDFLRAKENASPYSNVMSWDDAAARDSFLLAKARFRAHHYDRAGDRRQRRLPLPPLPSPDSHVEEVVWEESAGEEERRLAEEMEEEREAALRKVAEAEAAEEWLTRNPIPLEEIQATGWDDEDDGRVGSTLTGMIVGGGGDDWDVVRGCLKRGGGGDYKENDGGKAAAAGVNKNWDRRREVNWSGIANNVGL